MGAPRQNRGMKVFGIAGHSGMGKTTLLERVAPTGRTLTQTDAAIAARCTRRGDCVSVRPVGAISLR
jgi:molybdopterin-guanine dinucleotide biosynthesis protein